MEGLAAFSVAVNVVQFLDFGQKLSQAMFDIWRSAKGLTKSNFNTRMLAQVFWDNLDSVAHNLTEYHKFLHGENVGTYDTTHAQRQMQGVIDGCRDLASELIKRIDKLRCNGPPRGLDSLFAAFKSLWEERDLKRLEKEFDKYKAELDSLVLFSLRYELGSLLRTM